jgi:hypothetical protein
MILTSSELCEQLNRLKLAKGFFFLPSIQDHIDRLEIVNEELLVHTNYKDIVSSQIEYGPAITVFYDTTPVAMFGFVLIWHGVAESWLVTDDLVRSRPVGLTKYGIAAHDIAKISLGLHRQQITVRITDKRAFKWALALGFKLETVMHMYGPDKVDYCLMTRF